MNTLDLDRQLNDMIMTGKSGISALEGRVVAVQWVLGG